MTQNVLGSQNYNPILKMIVLSVVIVAAVVTLLARLLWLQVLQNNYYRNQAIDNSTRVTFLRAPRGTIYDRHGNLLATNKQSLSMIAIPMQIEHAKDLAYRLSKVLDEPTPKVLNVILKAKASHSPVPVVIERDLDVDTVSRFYEQKLFLPGIDILPDISRNYTQGELVAHAIGYCGQITQSQLALRPDRRMGDIVGQDGIKRLYDVQLRGVDGEQRVRVNAMGQSLSAETSKPIVTKEPIPGRSIVTSIDLDLQRTAFQALGARSGAVRGHRSAKRRGAGNGVENRVSIQMFLLAKLHPWIGNASMRLTILFSIARYPAFHQARSGKLLLFWQHWKAKLLIPIQKSMFPVVSALVAFLWRLDSHHRVIRSG